MIHSFYCKNFYSCKDEVEVNFVVNDQAPDTEGYSYYGTNKNKRLSLVETVIGPNASGKTHLLKVLPFFQWAITASIGLKKDEKLPVKPFIFDKYLNHPIDLGVTFSIKNDIYTYFLSLTKDRILKEELKVTSLARKNYSTKKLFSRLWNKKNSKYEFLFPSKKFLINNDLKKSIRENITIINSFERQNHEVSSSIVAYWQKIRSNIKEMGLKNDHGGVLENSLILYSKNDFFKQRVEDLLKKYNTGIEKIVFKKDKDLEEDWRLEQTMTTHRFGEYEYPLPLMYESSGTKQLLIVLSKILPVLEKGGAAIIDELDANLHPDLVRDLVDLFLNIDTNPHRAQLLVSAHSHILLSKLDKYQIVLVEKNEQGISEVWRLDEMEGVRADDNYYMKYIAGAYGAKHKL